MSKTGGGQGTNQYQTKGRSIGVTNCLVPIMPKTTLEELAADGQWAEDIDWPPDLLLQMARSPQRSMRLYVAQHAQCQTQALGWLAVDSDRDIRLAVAQHPRCSEAILTGLTRDRSPEVWATALRHPAYPQAALIKIATGSARAKACVAISNPACPVATLRELARTEDNDIARVLIRRQDTPEDVLSLVIQRHQHFVKDLDLLVHPNCPMGVLMEAIETGDSLARSKAIQNPRCPEHIKAIAVLG